MIAWMKLIFLFFQIGEKFNKEALAGEFFQDETSEEKHFLTFNNIVKDITEIWLCSSVGRAFDWRSKGRRIETVRSHGVSRLQSEITQEEEHISFSH